jgi:hypothetical protein
MECVSLIYLNSVIVFVNYNERGNVMKKMVGKLAQGEDKLKGGANG